MLNKSKSNRRPSNNPPTTLPYTTTHQISHNYSLQSLLNNSRTKTPIPIRPPSTHSSHQSTRNNEQKISHAINNSQIADSGKDKGMKTYNEYIKEQALDNRSQLMKENLNSDTPSKTLMAGNRNIDELIEYAKNSLNDSKFGKPLFMSTPESPKIPFNITKQPLNNDSTCADSKWKKFGMMMADSYEDLKKKYKVSLESLTKSQQITIQLKGQVDKYKKLLQLSKEENETLTASKANNDELTSAINDLQRQLNEKDQTIHSQSQHIDELQSKLQQNESYAEQMKCRNKVIT